MSTLSTLFALISYTRKCPGIKNKYLGFLLTGLTVMGHHRVKLRQWWIDQISSFSSSHNDVELKVLINHKALILSIRPGNIGDYIIGGEFIKSIYKVPIEKPDLIIDGGANIGIFSLYASSYFPSSKLVCYEPDLDNYNQLKKNLSKNDVQAEAYQLGLWSSNICLYFHSASSETGFISETSSDIQINCILPEISHKTWLKLDVEGSEYEVLPALFEKHQYPYWISMEIHQLNTKGKDLVDLLKKHNYKILGRCNFDVDCDVITAYRDK